MFEITSEDIKYLKFYKPNDLFWGLGVENETYLMLENPIILKGKFIKENHKRERYSIDYNSNYKEKELDDYLEKCFSDNDDYYIPQYLNSHSFTKTDINGEHKTLYSPKSEENS